VALYPSDPIVAAGNVECRENPELLLQGKPANDRLVSSGKKDHRRYKAKFAEIADAWSLARQVCPSEAQRFSIEFLAAVRAINP
jgi:hypothetical protein